MELFAACAPGLEPVVAAELTALGAAPRVVAGGVELSGDLRLLYRAALELGCAVGLLVRLGRFPARHFDTLSARAAALPWSEWLRPGDAVRVRASCRRSRLYHSGAVAERVRAAIADALGAPVVEPASTGRVRDALVRLERDRCTISIDAVTTEPGDGLQRRGYRLASGKAPLREDLARALVIASGWDRASPLIDPFCGAGTIAIEADWLARRVPPGHLRRFAFEDAPGFDAALWGEVRAGAMARVRDDRARILASDRDPGAVEMAAANAARAGSEHIERACAPLSKAPAWTAGPGPVGAVVTNPPYGRRTGRPSTLQDLYAALGTRVRALGPGWRCAVVSPAHRELAATGLGLRTALMTDHGGSKVYFAVGDGAGIRTARGPARR